MRPLAVILALATCWLMAICAGCAGSRAPRAGLVAANGTAPDDVSMRPDPNAPYILPGGAPRLIPRATALEAANAGPCDPDVLSVEEISGDSSGVFRSVKLAFMNRGATPCRLGGYPTIALLDPEGESIGSVSMEKVSPAVITGELSQKPAAEAVSSTPTVTLMPHAVAAFQVAWIAGPDCSRVSRILVAAPGTERVFSVAQPMRICSGQIQVTELRLDEGDV